MFPRRCAVVVLGVVALPAGAQDALERVERYFGELATLSAHFEQTVRDADGDTVASSGGTLEVKRPGRFRWDYAPPHAQLVVADGTRLWMYDPELEQVTVKTLDTTLGSTPAMLLSGSGRIGEAYELKGEQVVDGLRWVELAPRAADSDFRRVRLGFAGEELRRMELTDTLDQQTDIELSALQRNPALDDARFAFVPPPGTDLVGDAPPAVPAP